MGAQDTSMEETEKREERSRLLDLMKHQVEAETAHDLASTLATLTSDCLFEDMALQEKYRGHEGAQRATTGCGGRSGHDGRV